MPKIIVEICGKDTPESAKLAQAIADKITTTTGAQVENAVAKRIRRLENKARKLWNLSLFPGAWQYQKAETLWDNAQFLKTQNDSRF